MCWKIVEHVPDEALSLIPKGYVLWEREIDDAGVITILNSMSINDLNADHEFNYNDYICDATGVIKTIQRECFPEGVIL